MAGPSEAGTRLLAAAQALTPEIAARADEIERERRLPPTLVDALAEAGLFRMLVPASLGGSELDLPSFPPVIEALARADASVAWCVSQAAVFAMVSAWMPRESARAIFGDDRGAVVANGPRPDGTALVVEGGYRVTGRWSFSSGCRHATWLSGFSTLYEGGAPRLLPDGSAQARFLLFPAEQAELIDTWQVAGLRGTGSFDFAVSDLFVPRDHSVAVGLDPRRENGPIYLFPQRTFWGSGFAAVALGAARGALDALLALATEKTAFGANGRLREQALVQMQVGEAEARLRSARAWLWETLGEVWAAVCAGGEVTLAQRALIRLAATHATHQAKQAVELAYTAAGTSAIYAGSPLQRRFQDVQVAAQHVMNRPAHYESVGRFFLGLEPDLQWL